MKYWWFRQLLFAELTLISSLGAFSQDSSATEVKKQRVEKRPAYIDISFGLSHSGFRDFATSPLRYSGTPVFTALTHLEMDDSRKSQITLSYAFGDYSTKLNEHNTGSKVNTISLNYLELYQIGKLSSPKFNFKMGGQFNATVNHRQNEDFFNNSEGVDIIATLFGSVKGTLDLSRSTPSKRKFLFFRYRAKKRVKKLSYTLNAGLINSSFRNGFAYLSSSTPINRDDFFADYELKVFRGFRLNSALDYTVFLDNTNAVQFSYLWDAYKTGGHHDNFEMVSHTLKCSLLFNLR